MGVTQRDECVLPLEQLSEHFMAIRRSNVMDTNHWAEMKPILTEKEAETVAGCGVP